MKISVLTPAYEAGGYLKRAITSVMAQEDPNFEHIIVDGGSKDGTLDLLQQFPHLTWISEQDRGQSDAMNKAFDLATGDIIVYLNADDWFAPGAFAAVRSHFELHPQADIVVGNLTLVEGTKETLIIPEVAYTRILQHFKYVFPINPVAYFYKRTVQEDFGRFPLKESHTMDFYFLLKTFGKFKAEKISANLGYFDMRVDTKTGASNARNNCRNCLIRYAFLHNPKILPFYLYAYVINELRTLYWQRIKQPVLKMTSSSINLS
ncbi:MAG: glycosyltransferase family 2 protein [Bacteroidota bacterium]